jgi:hypothetical protein
VEPDRSRTRTLVEHDVETEVLHCRVDVLLHDSIQPVNLVDEEDLLILEVGEDPGEIARALDHRPGGDPRVAAHFPGEDAGQSRLAQTGRSHEEHVIQRLPALLRRLEKDLELIAQLRLPDEVLECFRTKSAVPLPFAGSDARVRASWCRGHLSPECRPGAA